jgi:hypothetical protein
LKTFLIATTLLAATNISAQEFSISAIYDYDTEKSGLSLTYGFDGTELITPRISVLSIPTEKTQYAVGMEALIGEYLDYGFRLGTDLVYQENDNNTDGTGMNVSFTVDKQVAQSTYMTLGVSHFSAFSDQLENTEGTSINTGLRVEF